MGVMWWRSTMRQSDWRLSLPAIPSSISILSAEWDSLECDIIVDQNLRIEKVNALTIDQRLSRANFFCFIAKNFSMIFSDVFLSINVVAREWHFFTNPHSLALSCRQAVLLLMTIWWQQLYGRVQIYERYGIKTGWRQVQI